MEIGAILTDKLKQDEETVIHPGGARSGAGKAIDKGQHARESPSHSL